MWLLSRISTAFTSQAPFIIHHHDRHHHHTHQLPVNRPLFRNLLLNTLKEPVVDLGDLKLSTMTHQWNLTSWSQETCRWSRWSRRCFQTRFQPRCPSPPAAAGRPGWRPKHVIMPYFIYFHIESILIQHIVTLTQPGFENCQNKQRQDVKLSNGPSENWGERSFLMELLKLLRKRYKTRYNIAHCPWAEWKWRKVFFSWNCW